MTDASAISEQSERSDQGGGNVGALTTRRSIRSKSVLRTSAEGGWTVKYLFDGSNGL